MKSLKGSESLPNDIFGRS